MKPKRLVLRTTLFALLGSLSAATGACGFLLTHGPPAGHEQMDYFTCTEGDVGPILDFVWAGLNVAGAIACAAQSDESFDDSYYDKGTCTAIGLTWGVISTTSGVVGVNKTNKCRAAKRQLAERLARGRAAERAQPADVIVQTVVLTPSADTLGVGEQLQIVATAYNSAGTSVANKVFAWSSSNDAIASVSSAGLVTAHAIGSVVVAARADNVVGTSRLTVVSSR